MVSSCLRSQLRQPTVSGSLREFIPSRKRVLSLNMCLSNYIHCDAPRLAERVTGFATGAAFAVAHDGPPQLRSEQHTPGGNLSLKNDVSRMRVPVQLNFGSGRSCCCAVCRRPAGEV